MKVAFFTEMNFNGKIPRTHTNMRTEFAWMVALNADHYNLKQTPDKEYDLGIAINSKNSPEQVDVERYKTKCKEVAVMQEGPFWYYQESLMIEDPISNLTDAKNRSGVMIGGNMKSWYGGFDSYILARSVTSEIYSPQMGRRQEGEEQLGIKQLPYMEWNQWISELSKRKIGVHMMRTHAAGTFALNCSYLGIPCIGYKGLDTQRILHPELSVEDGDLTTARKLINKLENDKEFYILCSDLTKLLYQEHYHESKFKI